ncbi:MAG: DAK2 domain-containing protein, partial [Bacillota bacterium]|nr:DAK2 domain-containing protein [Bacillota bacterium]
MATKQIDASLLRRMFIAGARNLEMNKDAVDALNVFPVPDGDTGTNMNLTLQAVVKALDKGDLSSCAQVAQAVATGSLMGARGNSGVILSQLFRGFARAAERKDVMTSGDFALALMSGVEIAYKAVGRPVEGTILTVSREAAKAAQNKARSEADIAKLLTATIEQAERTLAKTPEMLPVLKRAGVVDAGGQGLIHIYRGFLLAVEGKEISAPRQAPAVPVANVVPPIREFIDVGTIEFQYCTELLILKPKVEDYVLRQSLEEKGHYDSLLVVGDGDVIKVHVHTNQPGAVLEMAIQHGELSGIKIENMKEQHQHTHWAEEFVETPRPGEGKNIGVVAVAAGPGLGDVFRSLGVDVIVEGGQTMNPSTEDLAAAVNSLACEAAIILPNNKNIIMAAAQVKEITSKHVLVVGSHT